MTVIGTSTTINAPIDLVWKVLSTFDCYVDWNSFILRNTCDGVVGNDFVLDVRMGCKIRKNQVETLVELNPDEYRLSWGAEQFGISALRIQQLTQQSDDKTLYTTEESFSGFMIPLVMMLYRSKIQQGFEDMAADLKAYCENNVGSL